MTVTAGSWRHVGDSYERPMGPSEIAFFAGSADGTGDMCLHVSLSATPELMSPDHVALAWAVLRARHPLLASTISVKDRAEWAVHFVYTHPSSAAEALDDARSSSSFNHTTKEELIDTHMNGTRSLSETKLSHLTISTPETTSTSTSSSASTQYYDVFLAAPHFAGDGLSLHACMHELLLLLGEGETSLQAELDSALPLAPTRLPLSLEAQLPQPKSQFQRAAHAVDYQIRQAKDLGGHVLPRKTNGEKKTLVQEVALDEETTARILSRCKKEGVTISSAIFALVAMAWALNTPDGLEPDLPILMYSALSLRNHLPPSSASGCFSALGYFNIILPSFLPAPTDMESRFWHRARSVRAQTLEATSSRQLIPRSLAMSAERQARALKRPPPFQEVVPGRAPSKALCGLSMIGNLDRTYIHDQYTPGLELHTVTAASRLRPGAFLLVAHTFKGRLWFHLVWDKHGFEQGVLERFWDKLPEVLAGFCSSAAVEA